jgi:hypothetical protein
MARTAFLVIGLTVSGLFFGSGGVSPAAADDFSVENSVYEGRNLVGRSTTLFAGDKVYDLLTSPDEAIVFDLAAERITLVDNGRKFTCEFSTEEVVRFCDRVRDRARSSGTESMRFAADPDFRESLDPETNEVVLAGAWLEYRARTTAPPNAEVLKRYEAYVLRQAQLNTLMNPGAPPPSARLKLNEALARRQQLPQQVSLRRISVETGGGKSLRAEHHYTWRLGDPDRERIAAVERALESHRPVTVREYLDGGKKTASR